MIDFLRNALDPLFVLMGATLSTFHGWGAPWWLSIVMLTVVVRSLLFPITYRQVRSMRRMQELKPDMDRIRTEHKDDVQRQREEMARLYQERKVNPLGGCLPILIQLPIFLVLYYTIRHFDTLESFRTGGLFWFQDLTQPDHLYILPVLYVLTMMASQEITIRNTAPQQAQIMRLMPLVFGGFLAFSGFPSGPLRLLDHLQLHHLRPELRDLLRPPAQKARGHPGESSRRNREKFLPRHEQRRGQREVPPDPEARPTTEKEHPRQEPEKEEGWQEKIMESLPCGGPAPCRERIFCRFRGNRSSGGPGAPALAGGDHGSRGPSPGGRWTGVLPLVFPLGRAYVHYFGWGRRVSVLLYGEEHARASTATYRSSCATACARRRARPEAAEPASRAPPCAPEAGR